MLGLLLSLATGFLGIVLADAPALDCVFVRPRFLGIIFLGTGMSS